MNNLCATVNFRRFQGDTWIIPFAVTDANENPIDVSDIAAAIFALFDQEGAEVTRVTLGSGISVSDNLITVTIADANTTALLGSYLYEMEIIDANGNRQTIVQGEAESVKTRIANA